MKKLIFILLCFCLMTFGSSAKIIEVAPAGAWGVLAMSGGGGAVADVTAPEWSSTTVSADGDEVTVVFSENLNDTALGGGEFDLDCDGASGADNVLVYASGDGTATWVFAATSTVQSGESCTTGFDGAANEAEDDAGNDLADYGPESVTNNSTQGGVAISLEAQNSGANTAETSTWAIDLNGCPADSLIVAVATSWRSGGTQTHTVSDDVDGSYTQLNNVVTWASNMTATNIFYLEGASSGNRTITLTLDKPGSWFALNAACFSGIATTSASDGAAVSATATSAGPASSGNYTNTSTDALLIGFVGTDGSATPTESGDWIEINTVDLQLMMYQVVSTAAARAATATLSESDIWVAEIGGFKP